MNGEYRDLSAPPAPLEEGYWEALMREGEYAAPTRTNVSFSTTATSAEAPPNDPTPHPANIDEQVIEQDWQAIEHVMNTDDTVTLNVIGYNRGGLLVAWRHIRGFVPASQLMDFPTEAAPSKRQAYLEARVGHTLQLRVIELNRNLNRLVLSERAAQVQPGARAEVLQSVEAGEIVEGNVTNITDFGVFVDLGGIEGLVHISELSWGRVAHPRDILAPGQQVRLYVLETNQDAGRIALSLKRLHDDPWQTVMERYKVGQVVQCRITNVVDFGAFACLEKGLEGLIHVSELAEGQFLHPRNVIEEGETIFARILNLQPEHRRLGLSLRQVDTPHPKLH
jgi:small subunit ribosomal protein S1